jgi:hypothetical protein
LRYSPSFVRLKDDPRLGTILGCETYGPCSLEEHHPDLFWYGIHGVEALFAIMGTGCETVSRAQSPTTELVTGVWTGGRIGTFRGVRSGRQGYGALVFGANAIQYESGNASYDPLLVEIVQFFKTKKPPLNAQEIIEVYAFMEAADESKRLGGAAVAVRDVIEKAQREARAAAQGAQP